MGVMARNTLAHVLHASLRVGLVSTIRFSSSDLFHAAARSGMDKKSKAAKSRSVGSSAPRNNRS